MDRHEELHKKIDELSSKLAAVEEERDRYFRTLIGAMYEGKFDDMKVEALRTAYDKHVLELKEAVEQRNFFCEENKRRIDEIIKQGAEIARLTAVIESSGAYIAMAERDQLRVDNAALKDELEKAKRVARENYDAANAYMAIAEQADHNKTADKLIAANKDNAALRAARDEAGEKYIYQQQRADKFWLMLCETAEALGKVAPEAAPYAAEWARQLRAELSELQQRYDELVQQIRGIGARIPCTTGGTFENDPPDAIVDACWRECRDVKASNAALRAAVYVNPDHVSAVVRNASLFDTDNKSKIILKNGETVAVQDYPDAVVAALAGKATK